ncbi:MAG: thioredoxin family protein [Lachnospiraceae bacterium]
MKVFILILFYVLLVFTACNSTETDYLKPIDNSSELYEIISKSDASYIYFGRPTCPDCEEFQPILEEVLTIKNQYIFYYNTDDRKNDDIYDEFIELFDITWIPTIYKVKDNAIIAEFPLKFEHGTNETEKEECRIAIESFLAN